jgi:hypothetical protein
MVGDRQAKGPHFELRRVGADGDQEVSLVSVGECTPSEIAGVRVERRDFLRTLGLATVGLTAASCVGPSPSPRPTVARRHPRPAQAPQVPATESLPELDQVRAHQLSVTCVAFNASGSLLASGSRDRTVKLWDPVSCEVVRTFTGHEGAVSAVSFVGEKKCLASAGADRVIRLWDGCRGQLEGHEQGITGLAGGPRNASLASSSWDGSWRIWYPASGGELRRGAMSGGVCSVAFSPDGKLLACGGGRGDVTGWDISTGRQLRRAHSHAGRVSAVAFSPDGGLLASGGAENRITLWAADSLTEKASLSGHKDYVNSLVFSPCGRMLASASSDWTIRLWSVPEGGALRILRGHTGDVNGIDISPDGTLLASGSNDLTVRVWDLVDFQAERTVAMFDPSATPEYLGTSRYTYTDEYGMTRTYTQPCGSPVPPNSVCVCNCVPGTYVPTLNPFKRPKRRGGGGFICTCNKICTCVPICF